MSLGSKARARQKRLLFWGVLLLSTGIIVGIASQNPPRRVVVYESNVRADEIRRIEQREKDAAELLRRGDRRQVDRKLVDFGKLKEDHIKNAAELTIPCESFLPLPGRNYNARLARRALEELFPQLEASPVVMSAYLESCVAQGLELIGFTVRLQDPPAVEEIRKSFAQKKSEIGSNDMREKLDMQMKAELDAAYHAHSGESTVWNQALQTMMRLQQSASHLYTLGRPSSFNMYSCTNGEVQATMRNVFRVRVPATYTDLGRLLMIHANQGDAEALIKSINQSQHLTAAMLATYALLRESVKISLTVSPERKLEDWEKSSKDGGLSDYAKAVRLFDFLCLRCRYDVEALHADNETHVVNAILGKRATSVGYARTYMLLLTMAGIENRYVVGTRRLANGETVEHCWNMAKLDGNWVHIDAAFSDRVQLVYKDKHQQKRALVSHTAFALSDKGMQKMLGLKDGEWKALAKSLPGATNEDMYYFRKRDITLNDGKKSNLVLQNGKQLVEVVVNRAYDGVFCDEYCAPGISLQEVQDSCADFQLKSEDLRLNVQMSSPDENGNRLITVDFQEK